MSEGATVAQTGPFEVELEAGRTYAWCACGRSARQPFCDGAHQTTALRPVVFKAKENAVVYLCGCKATTSSPYCDGTHNSL